MEGGKDDRSKDKRRRMRIKQIQRGGNSSSPRFTKPPAGHTSSSSAQADTTVRGIIDVADSSDEQRFGRSWASSTVPKQHGNRDFLDDTELDDVENAQMNAGDFKLMSQLPTSVGGHFQFASEKSWDNLGEGEQLLDSTEASEYFTLNLKLLNVGLQTIPFHKRMDYPASMFTQDQLISMEKTAEVAEKNYQNVLKEHETNPRIKINSGSRKSGGGGAGSAKSQRSAKPSASVGSNAPDELDEWLSMTTAQVAKVSLDAAAAVGVENVAPSTAGNGNEGSVVGNKDDIQQWLDNVLEE